MEIKRCSDKKNIINKPQNYYNVIVNNLYLYSAYILMVIIFNLANGTIEILTTKKVDNSNRYYIKRP